MAEASGAFGSPLRVFGERDYRPFWASRLLGSLGSEIQSVTMGWQVYAISRRTLDVPHAAFNVSLIGLCTFGPLFVLALIAGESADRYDRRSVLLVCYAGELAVAAALAFTAFAGSTSVPLMLGLAALFGTARAFFNPAMTALAPMLVSRSQLPRAIVLNSLAGDAASMAGPAIAGMLIAISPASAFTATLLFYAGAALALVLIRADTRPPRQHGSRLELVRQGLAYVWANKLVFGAMSLDLVAVILGGATALLPAFARDVLHVGARGFGFLRAGPAIGAGLVGLALRPIHSKAGAKMLAGVAVFGAATLVFAFSRSLILSVLALAVLGGADMLSVFVRQTLVQLVTPDPMRGRVAAVSGLFIGASNELGEFESGVAARFLGVVGAAVFGGAGALCATAVWARLFPALRRADRLE
ncbi:MAG TPA: MFS transporter [Caulobacteraceae bacterium]|nr:MFS transporter [Caulobacteraceae bacterium]